MQIKNFQAKTIQDALAMVRREFGGDAVVLKTDVVKDGGLKMFCVTAAREEIGAAIQQPATATRVQTAGSGPAVAETATTNRELESAILDVILPDLLQGESKEYYLRLRAHDIKPDLAREICRRWQQHSPPTLDSLKEILGSIAPATCDLPRKGTDIVFVGPCGSGKSTLLAKIATKLVFQDHEKVTLSTLDNFRPGAEQEISSINEIVEMVGEAREEYKSRKAKYHLVDTAGLVTGDREGLDELRDQLTRMKRRFVVAALPLTSSWRQIRRFLTFAEPLEIDATVFTHCDASDCCGVILDYAAADYPPVWGISDSRLPTDTLRDFDIDSEFVKLIGETNE